MYRVHQQPSAAITLLQMVAIVEMCVQTAEWGPISCSNACWDRLTVILE